MSSPTPKNDRRLFRRLLLVFLVVGLMAAYGLHAWLASDFIRLRRAEGVAAACFNYASDHKGYLTNRLDDLIPEHAPGGIVFTDISPEEAIMGYDYLGAGTRLTDPSPIIILHANDPTSDGGRIIVFLGGKGEIQAAK
jgi:hypothetical protein